MDGYTQFFGNGLMDEASLAKLLWYRRGLGVAVTFTAAASRIWSMSWCHRL